MTSRSIALMEAYDVNSSHSISRDFNLKNDDRKNLEQLSGFLRKLLRRLAKEKGERHINKYGGQDMTGRSGCQLILHAQFQKQLYKTTVLVV